MDRPQCLWVRRCFCGYISLHTYVGSSGKFMLSGLQVFPVPFLPFLPLCWGWNFPLTAGPYVIRLPVLDFHLHLFVCHLNMLSVSVPVVFLNKLHVLASERAYCPLTGTSWRVILLSGQVSLPQGRLPQENSRFYV